MELTDFDMEQGRSAGMLPQKNCEILNLGNANRGKGNAIFCVLRRRTQVDPSMIQVGHIMYKVKGSPCLLSGFPQIGAPYQVQVGAPDKLPAPLSAVLC